jgi:hypothetical protein
MKIRVKAEDIQRRNPVARALGDAQFRSRTVRDRTKYTRKQKHRKGDFQ